MTSSTVYQNWPLGWLDGILDESGIYDNTPLYNLIKKYFTQFGSLKRKVVVASADVNTGKYVLFDEKLPFADWPLFPIASSSIPFIFPHRHYGDHILMDGGTMWNTNLVSAVDKCKDMGFADNQIILDIVICGRKDHPTINNNTGNAMNNYLRYYSIQQYYKGFNDILEFKRSRPNVQYRYLIMPSAPTAEGLDMLNFNPSNTLPMFDLGSKDAAAALKKLEGRDFELLEKYMSLPQELQDQVTIHEYVFADGEVQF
jgi:predicted patatin/cPLA2 family phospholipase